MNAKPGLGEVTGSARPMFFMTSKNRRIEFVDGYYEAHNRKRAGYVSDNVFVENLKGNDRVRLHSEPFSYQSFIKDVGVFSLMRDALFSIGLKGPWNRALDIGGAEGAVARLVRGSGLAKWVACNDYVNLSDKLPTQLFLKHYARYRIARATRGRLPKFRLPDLATNLGPTAATSDCFWRHQMKGPPSVDAYIAEDFYKIEGDQHFDLMSSLLVMNYFDAEEKMAKVSSLLTDGGVFVLLASSFWWPVNAAMIIGKFPYTSQRLDRDDLHRYLLENHPTEAADAMKRYDYFHKTGRKPTLDDYIEMADRHGLSLLKADYIIPLENKHKKTALTPFAIESSTDLSLPAVLADVQAHRPDIRMIDLKAAYVMGVFRKRGPATRTASAMVGR